MRNRTRTSRAFTCCAAASLLALWAAGCDPQGGSSTATGDAASDAGGVPEPDVPAPDIADAAADASTPDAVEEDGGGPEPDVQTPDIADAAADAATPDAGEEDGGGPEPDAQTPDIADAAADAATQDAVEEDGGLDASTAADACADVVDADTWLQPDYEPLASSWVVPSEDPTCPAPTATPEEKWAFGRLFENPWEGAESPDQHVDGLGGWFLCFYEWLDSPPQTLEEVEQIEEALLAITPEPSLFRDLPVVVPLGAKEELRDAVWQNLHQHALAQLEAPAAASELQLGGPVTVAVIDTSLLNDLSGFPGTGKSTHGRDVGLLIRKLVCPDNGDACAVRVRTHLGLDLVPDPGVPGGAKQDPDGGYFGTPARLARAMWEALKEWKEHYPNDKLILNLSVGWEGALQEPWSLPALAVKAVASLAWCEDVLVIAAAGNDHDGSTPSEGPMYPAAFEKEGAGPSWCSGGPASYQPLVHAVGGLDSQHQPLANTRDNGRPRLAAYAFQVVADTDFGSPGAPDGPTIDAPPLTGTSMAAAAVSAAAAVRWSNEPTLDRHEVMNDIYEEGSPLASGQPASVVLAEFCAPGTNPCPEIRRITMCAAIKAADPTAQCSDPYPSPDPSWTTTQLAQAKEAAAVEESLAGLDGLPVEDCGTGITFYGEAGEYPRPDEQAYNYIRQPAVVPLPTIRGCGVCQLLPSNGALTLVAMPSDVEVVGDGLTLHDVRLKFMGQDSNVISYVALPGTLQVGQLAVFTDLPAPSDVQSAELVGLVDGYADRLVVVSMQIPIQQP